jgi:hypothetical protein
MGKPTGERIVGSNAGDGISRHRFMCLALAPRSDSGPPLHRFDQSATSGARGRGCCCYVLATNFLAFATRIYRASLENLSLRSAGVT